MNTLYSKYEKKFLVISFVALFFLIYQKYLSAFPVSEYLQLAISLTAYFLIAIDVVIGAIKTLVKQRRMSEQFLMVVATIGAFLLADFPEALAVMIFYKVGKLFEDHARGRAHNDISSLVKLRPTCVRVIDESGNEGVVKPRAVKIGQIIKVLKGEIVALDGDLIEDSAAIDTSAITGESEPRLFLKGQSVPSGCINQGRVITLKVNTLHKNSSITKLLNLIEDANTNKSRPEKLIRRFAIFYTPIVVAFACILALVPLFIESATFSDWVERALMFLVVSCPCALVLSVPLSFFGGLGAISKKGVIVKGSIFIETLSKIKAIAFDKTGTLTYGRFAIDNIECFNSYTKEDVLTFALSLEKNSTHPLAQSIVDAARKEGLPEIEARDIEEFSGLGICALVDNKKVYAGKDLFVQKYVDEPLKKVNSSKTPIYVAVDNKLCGIIELADEVKKEAKDCICALKSLGIKTCLISGDKKAVVEEIASYLGIDRYYYEQSPKDKIEKFKALKNENNPMSFVGDGLNDAPVLALADVGIAMGDMGSASAVESADIVVMNDNLSSIIKTIELSKKTLKLAISNMYLVMLIKLAILILGACGIANIWLAIFGDVGVLILAVANAMRSLRFK